LVSDFTYKNGGSLRISGEHAAGYSNSVFRSPLKSLLANAQLISWKGKGVLLILHSSTYRNTDFACDLAR